MALFNLIVDEKVTIWRRNWITVEADSLEEAVDECLVSGAECATDTQDYEYLSETEEYIYPSEEHPCTVEIMDENYHTLKTDERRD